MIALKGEQPVAPAQVGVQVGEEPDRAPDGQLPGPVGDVGLEDSP